MPQAIGFDVVGQANVKVLNGAQVSNLFSVPINMSAMTIWVPALDATTVWRIQALGPVAPDSNPVWQDVWYWDSGTGTFKQLISANTDVSRAVVISALALPGGVIRLATSINQTADRQFFVWFSQVQR
jgi:hypothetical protein